MKKYILILAQITLLLSGELFSQSMSPDGVFDVVYDHQGNQYPLSNLNVRSTKPLGGPGNINTLPTSSCSAGYFTLWFTQGSLCDLNATAQTIVCQVFTDLSNFIPSPLTASGLKVNMIVSDLAITAANVNALANAGPFFVFPTNPVNPYPGIVESQLHKAIVTGTDPYLNIPIQFYNATAFYHGQLNINAGKPWSYGTGATTLTPGTYDFGSTILHEALHALGFMSMIEGTGFSGFGQTNNYYTRYDQFLYDSAGNPLLTSSTPTLCPNNNISFALTPSTSINVNTSTVGCILDSTDCSIAMRYVGSTTVTVYTPNCFTTGSSLSHFEDICSHPNYSTVCTGTVPIWNNQYFVMSNSTHSASACYIKRFPKPEERLVLCDLGYSVNPTYSTSGSSFIDGNSYSVSYGGSMCSSSLVVYGLNDGVVSGSYIYTTTGTSLAIPHYSVLLNDFPTTGVTVSCLDLVYSNATLSPGISDFTVSASLGSGMVLLKYLPKHSASGQLGSPTYIYVYFLPPNCNPSGMCNLVQNGDFENVPLMSSHICGPLTTIVKPSCWLPFQGNGSLLRRNCTTGNVYNLGTTTFGTSSGTLNSYSGSGNDIVVGLSWINDNINFGVNVPGVIKNNLSGPIVPTHTYQISMFVDNYSPMTFGYGQNVNSSPVVLTVASAPAFANAASGPFPIGLNPLVSFTVNAGNVWSQITQTFVFIPSTSDYALVIGIDLVKTLAVPASSFSIDDGILCFIDGISLIELPAPVFSIPSPTICGNQSITDLAQYVSPSTAGSFSYHVTQTGPQYDFNLNSTLSPGNYPISFTYSSTAYSCTNTIYEVVTVGTNTNVVALNSGSLCLSTGTFDLNSLLTNTIITGTTFSINGILTSSTHTFTAGGVYTLAASNSATTVCSSIIYTTLITVYSSGTPVIFDGFSSPGSWSICSTNTLALSASSTNYSVMIWQPGGLIGPNQSLAPLTTTIYTVTAYAHSLCPSSQTFAIVTLTNCCHGYTLTPFSGSTVPASTLYAAPVIFGNDVTIPSTKMLDFINTSVGFINGAKLIVADGGILNVRGSHLFSCDANLWGGIVVQNGGYVGMTAHLGKDNLVEDALKAVDILTYTSTLLATVFDAQNTTFNKNYIDISISNYTLTNADELRIYDCVFTCRDLPFTPTSWPSTGTVSSVSTASADLRYTNVSVPVTSFGSPYLNQSFSITTLKSPYSNQTSYIAIQINTVGITSAVTMYGPVIGTTNAAGFNVFDAHAYYIWAMNSHVTSVNNVFQNTQTFTISTGFPPTVATIGGSAISHSTSNVLNTRLNVTGTSQSAGNRFWNCHIGIDAFKTFSLTVENSIFRSTQSSANTGFLPGNVGINANTNRFYYYITENEFTNLKTGINIPLSPGSFSSTGTSFTVSVPGVFADRLRISQNVFAGEVGGQSGSYMDHAVNITGPLTIPWYGNINPTVTPVVNAVAVNTNTFSEVHNAIEIDGVRGFPAFANNNTISLKFNSAFGAQYGIKLTNCQGSAITGFSSKIIVASNTASFSSAPSVTSGGLIWSGHNGYSLLSPSITCNNLAQGSQGFVFEGPSPHSIWAGNDIEPMSRGMVLSNNGKIGVQGSTNTAIGNAWTGSWTGKNHTYVDAASNATGSVLYVQNTSSCIPSNNAGPVPVQSYQLGNINVNIGGPGGEYNCTGVPNHKTVTIPYFDENVLTDELYYIDKLSMYPLLHLNDSVQNAGVPLINFYDDLSSGSIGKFWQIENYLYQGERGDAQDLLEEIDDEGLNTVEVNYKAFYSLYIAYLAHDKLSDGEKTDLYTLATLCPGTEGACVYQARALYNTLYNQILEPVCAGEEEERRSNVSKGGSSNKNGAWDLELFPNPAKDKLTIKSKTENELLTIMVKDLSGRSVLKKLIQVKGFIAILDIELVNGSYLIYITNSQNEKVAKKLIIFK